MNGLEYSQDPNNFYVRCNAPSRNYKDFRSELNTDANNLKETYSDMYVLFSSGVDSQIITRVFLDNNINCEFVFLNSVGYCDYELSHIRECEKYYGISVRVIDINIDSYEDQWVKRSNTENPQSMHHYPFEWLSKTLEKDYPLITQGANDPAILGPKHNLSIYCNYYEGMQKRFRLMSPYRKVIDFPYSPEAIASHYTDDNMKVFCSTIQYYKENNIDISQTQYYNIFGKGFVKGRHFKNDILWYGKRTGYESFPSWIKPQENILEGRVSIPYWDIVEFMENSRNTHRDYREWIYGNSTYGFTSIKSCSISS